MKTFLMRNAGLLIVCLASLNWKLTKLLLKWAVMLTEQLLKAGDNSASSEEMAELRQMINDLEDHCDT